MMKLLFSLLLLIVSAFAEEVVTLTKSNFQSTLDSNEFVLVEFYAPWCGHCKALAPEYEKAAVALKDFEPKVVIAKVDATAEEELAKEFDVQGFPTLKWFVNGKSFEYGGGRVEAEIVNWIKKKTGPPAKELADVAALEAFKDENEVAVVGVFKDQEQAKPYLSVAQGDDSVSYSIAYENAEIAGAVEVNVPGIAVYRKFDEPKVVFEGDASSSDEISKFVAANALPLIVAFSQENAPKIFGGEIKSHVLVFLDSSDADAKQKILDECSPVARKRKGEILFVTVDKTEERILEFFGITESDVPTARIVNLQDDGMKKYKYNGEQLNTEGISAFVDGYFAGSVEQDLKSEEPMPESEQEDVYVIVGKTFDEVVNRPGVNVLVEFYAPWCGHCKKLEPEYKALAEHFKGNDKVLIAKMDSTANEVAAVSVSGFPTIKLFPADSKEIIDYDGDRSKDALIKFVEENLNK